MKRKYKQNLLESFYIFTNSFTIALASDSQTIRNIIKDTFEQVKAEYTDSMIKKVVICHALCHNLEMRKHLFILFVIKLYARISIFNEINVFDFARQSTLSETGKF